MTTKYNVDYFIKKFESIPRRMWTIGSFLDDKGRKCVLGHCRKNNLPTEEGRFLFYLMRDELGVHIIEVNDGRDLRFKGKSPKTRVLNALKSIK